jgi:hypothetical protein
MVTPVEQRLVSRLYRLTPPERHVLKRQVGRPGLSPEAIVLLSILGQYPQPPEIVNRWATLWSLWPIDNPQRPLPLALRQGNTARSEFQRLLGAASPQEVLARLEHLFKAEKVLGGLDYNGLLNDLTRWYEPGRPVQLNWAQTWRNT